MILDFPTMNARERFVTKVHAEREGLAYRMRVLRNTPQVVVNEDAIGADDAVYLERCSREAEGRAVDDVQFDPTL